MNDPAQSADVTLALIGFGEAAMTFTKGWQTTGCPAIKAYDIKTNSPSYDIRQKKHDDYDSLGVKGCDSLREALEDANVVFSLVTAGQALIAARNAHDHLKKNILYLDCNSCAPETKREAEKIIAGAGGKYVDVAIMAPVQIDLRKVPLLLSGPHAASALELLEKFNMSTRIMAGTTGTASSVKMIRSIMVKGMEALMLECLLSARRAGVDEPVLESLEASFPGFNWQRRAAYMLERVTTHGLRRASEMLEVSCYIDHLGLGAKMAKATALWQHKIGALELETINSEEINYQILADAILDKLTKEKEQ